METTLFISILTTIFSFFTSFTFAIYGYVLYHYHDNSVRQRSYGEFLFGASFTIVSLVINIVLVALYYTQTKLVYLVVLQGMCLLESVFFKGWLGWKVFVSIIDHRNILRAFTTITSLFVLGPGCTGIIFISLGIHRLLSRIMVVFAMQSAIITLLTPVVNRHQHLFNRNKRTTAVLGLTTAMITPPVFLIFVQNGPVFLTVHIALTVLLDILWLANVINNFKLQKRKGEASNNDPNYYVARPASNTYARNSKSESDRQMVRTKDEDIRDNASSNPPPNYANSAYRRNEEIGGLRAVA